MDSSVQLSTEDLFITGNSNEALELAVLSGSMIVLLGDAESIAPDLALIMAGRKNPFSGNIFLSDESLNVNSHEARRMMEFVTSRYGNDISCSRKTLHYFPWKGWKEPCTDTPECRACFGQFLQPDDCPYFL